MERPEQKKTAHDLSDVFNPRSALPSSELSESAGAVTQNDIVNIVRGLAVVGPPRPPGPKGDSCPFNNVLLSHAVVAFDLPPPHPCPFWLDLLKEATHRHKWWHVRRTPRRVQ